MFAFARRRNRRSKPMLDQVLAASVLRSLRQSPRTSVALQPACSRRKATEAGKPSEVYATLVRKCLYYVPAPVVHVVRSGKDSERHA